jgi:hypothetical protein
VKTSNDEIISPRDLTRAPAAQFDRLAKGEVEKLVLMKGGKMTFVILPVEKYEELTGGESE